MIAPISEVEWFDVPSKATSSAFDGEWEDDDGTVAADTEETSLDMLSAEFM